MAGAQIGKTLIGKALVGYHIDHDPCPILMVQPTVEIGEVYSTDRLAPMIRDTPRLRAKVSDPKARNSRNTVKKKTFPGGYIAIAGANSAASLGSRPVRLVIFDEVDKFPASVKKEGDPVYLGKVRTKTFHNRKSLLMSTPTDLSTSRINAAWLASDMRRYYVPCPHCDGMQYLKWANVTWTDDNPDTAGYRCEHCAVIWDEADRTKATSVGGVWIPEHPKRKRAGFHVWEIYAPWRRMSEIVAEFLEAKKQPDTLKVFINTVLGECWQDEEGEKASDDNMLERREPYTPESLPVGVLVVVAGIDVQDDRVELEFKGYGIGEESWGIDFVVMHGDPGRGELWDRVGDQLKRTFTREDGAVLQVYQAGIDSAGHYTKQVYEFCRKRPGTVRALVGRSGKGLPIVKPGGKVKGLSVRMLIVGVDTAKELIIKSRLKIAEPGPGYMHFPISPAYGTEYFKQLTAERAVIKFKFGKPYTVWVLPSGARNEALDVNVYALAALTIKRPNLKALAARMQRTAPVPKATPAAPEPEQPKAAVQTVVDSHGRVRKKASYLAGYR